MDLELCEQTNDDFLSTSREVCFPSNPSFDIEDSKHELTWNTVQMMGSLVAMVITQVLVNGTSVNSSNI